MSDDEDERGAEEGNIEIFLRIKPIANPSKKVEYDLAEGKARPRCMQRRAAHDARRATLTPVSRAALLSRCACFVARAAARRDMATSCVACAARLRTAWRDVAGAQRAPLRARVDRASPAPPAPQVEFSVPRDEAWGLVNNTRERCVSPSATCASPCSDAAAHASRALRSPAAATTLHSTASWAQKPSRRVPVAHAAPLSGFTAR